MNTSSAHDNIHTSLSSFSFSSNNGKVSTPTSPGQTTSPLSRSSSIFDSPHHNNHIINNSINNSINNTHNNSSDFVVTPTTPTSSNHRRTSVHRKQNAMSFSSPKEFYSSFNLLSSPCANKSKDFFTMPGKRPSLPPNQLDNLISNTNEQIRRNSTNIDNNISNFNDFLKINEHSYSGLDNTKKNKNHIFAGCPETGDIPAPVIDLDILKIE